MPYTTEENQHTHDETVTINHFGATQFEEDSLERALEEHFQNA